jgi:hypothetical protein
MLNKSGKSKHPFLIPHFRKSDFSFFPFSMVLAIGLSFIAFNMLSYEPSILILFRAFIMYTCWILSKAFFCIYWDNYVIFILDCSYVILHYWFAYVQLSFHPWNETNFIMLYDLLNVLLNLASSIIENFCIYVHQRNWFIFLLMHTCLILVSR